MQRFVAIGKSRLQVLEAVPHAAAEATRIRTALDNLNPGLVHLDLTAPEHDLAIRGKDVGAFDAHLVPLLGRLVEVAPYAPHRAALEWATSHGAAVSLLLGSRPEAPPARKDLKGLGKMLKKEGFDARDAPATVDRFHLQYVGRVPGLVAWRDERRRQAADVLLRTHQDRARDAVVVLARPEADPVLDLVAKGQGRTAPTGPSGIPPPAFGNLGGGSLAGGRLP